MIKNNKFDVHDLLLHDMQSLTKLCISMDATRHRSALGQFKI